MQSRAKRAALTTDSHRRLCPRGQVRVAVLSGRFAERADAIEVRLVAVNQACAALLVSKAFRTLLETTLKVTLPCCDSFIAVSLALLDTCVCSHCRSETR